MNLITSWCHFGARASASSNTDPTLAVMRRTEVLVGSTAAGEEEEKAVSVLAAPSAAHSSSVSVDMAEETERLRNSERVKRGPTTLHFGICGITRPSYCRAYRQGCQYFVKLVNITS